MALLNSQEFLITSHILQKRNLLKNPCLYRFKMIINKNETSTDISEQDILQIGLQLFQTTLFNTGKSSRPLKETKITHESHKLSQEYAEKPDAIGVLHYKD